MRGIRRLLLLVVATTVAFGFAVVRFESAAEDGCAQRARSDASYRVEVRRSGGLPPTAGPDGADGTGRRVTGPVTYRLRAVRGDRAVRGADVCISAYMRGMSAMAVVGHAEEASAGTYEVTLDFPMAGEWTARVVVDEPDRRAVAVPLDLVVG